MSTTLLSPSERVDPPATGQPAPQHQEVKAWLHRMGADRLGHAHTKSLCQHLLNTRRILARWSQPVWTQNAGALHSIYATDVYKTQLIPLSERASVRSFVGHQAERTAFLFCTLPRQGLFAALDRRATTSNREAALELRSNAGNVNEKLNQQEIDSLLLIHMANEAEQAQSSDGGPGLWFERLCSMARHLSAATSPPPFLLSGHPSPSREQEQNARASYISGLEALKAGNRGEAAQKLSESSNLCPVWAEPIIWRAYLALQEGNLELTLRLTSEAKRQLSAIGVAWDKRLTFTEWTWLACALERLAAEKPGRAFSAPLNRRFSSLTERFHHPQRTASAEPGAVAETSSPHTEENISSSPLFDARFQQYMSLFADNAANPRMFRYPSLRSRPFHNAETFPIVVDLEANFEQIRQEVLALDENSFHPESEKSIKRSGSWQVLMLYERGRKNQANCDLCPTITRIIERNNTVKTLAGLMYVSRMSPHTAIQAHHGPTNMRLRCHLGIQVPGGDCAIKVGEEIRHWEEGRCLVFDDYYQHEAWNHTDEMRTVVILDIWHPELSRREIQLLEGLHRYVAAQTQSLNNYWGGNEKARRRNYD